MSEIKVAPNADVKNSDPNKAAIGLENDANQKKFAFKPKDITIFGNNGKSITLAGDFGAMPPAPKVDLNLMPQVSPAVTAGNLDEKLLQNNLSGLINTPFAVPGSGEKESSFLDTKITLPPTTGLSINDALAEHAEKERKNKEAAELVKKEKAIDTYLLNKYQQSEVQLAIENNKDLSEIDLHVLDKTRVSTSAQSKEMEAKLEGVNNYLEDATKAITKDLKAKAKETEKAKKRLSKLKEREETDKVNAEIKALETTIRKNNLATEELKKDQADLDKLKAKADFLDPCWEKTTELLKEKEKAKEKEQKKLEAAQRKKERKEKLDAFDRRMEEISAKVDKWILDAGEFLEHNFLNTMLDVGRLPGAEQLIGDELYRHSKDKSIDLNNAKVGLAEKVSYVEALNKEIEKDSEEAKKNNKEYFSDRKYFIEPGIKEDYSFEKQKEEILKGNDSESEKAKKLAELEESQEKNKQQLQERNKYLNEAWNGGFEWVLTVEERFDLFSKNLLEEAPKTDGTFKDVGGFYIFPDSVLESNLGGIEPVENGRVAIDRNHERRFGEHSTEIQEALNKALKVGGNAESTEVLDKDNIFPVPFSANQTKLNEERLQSPEEIPDAETLVKNYNKQKEINEERWEVKIEVDDLTAHPEEKKVNYKVVEDNDTPQMILGGTEPDEEKNVNIPIYELVSAGPDAQSNMFDVYFILYEEAGGSRNLVKDLFTSGQWNLDENNWLKIPEILSARIEDIKVPFFSRGSYETKFCGTSVQKPSGEVSGENKSSFKVRLDTSLFYLSLFNQMARLDPHGFNKKDIAEEENKLIKKRRYAFEDTVKPEMFNNARFCELPNIYANKLRYFDMTNNPKLNIAIRRCCYDYFNTQYRQQAMDKALDYGATYWTPNTEERKSFPNFNELNATGYKDDWFIFEDCKILGPNDALNFSRDSASTASMTYDFVFRRLQRASLYNPGRTLHETK